MQLTNSLVLLLASTAAALPLTRRDATTVLSDLASISSDVATLTSDATSYTGSLFQSLALVINVDSLKSAITTATSDTTASSTFSTTDSSSIVSAVTALVPNIVTLLADLDAKTSTVSSAGYTSLVESELGTLQGDADALFAALEAKVDSADAATLVTLQATVDAAFGTSEGDF